MIFQDVTCRSRAADRRSVTIYSSFAQRVRHAATVVAPIGLGVRRKERDPSGQGTLIVEFVSDS